MNLSDLYQEIILDHGRKPRNKREIDGQTHTAQGYNPLCGDEIAVHLLVDNGLIREATFTGHGCAISQASASLMTQAVAGQSVDHALGLFEKFRKVLTSGTGTAGCDHSQEPQWDEASEELGTLSCLTGVKNYPNRIKCATLAWHALSAALAGQASATTEGDTSA